MIPFSYLAQESNEEASPVQKRLAVLEDLVEQQGSLLSRQQKVLNDLKASNLTKDCTIMDNEEKVAELTAIVKQMGRGINGTAEDARWEVLNHLCEKYTRGLLLRIIINTVVMRS